MMHNPTVKRSAGKVGFHRVAGDRFDEVLAAKLPVDTLLTMPGLGSEDRKC